MLRKISVTLGLVFFASYYPVANASIVKSTLDSTKAMLKQHVDYPFYFGGSLGYGNTDWSEITTLPGTDDNPNLAAESAPISAIGSGFAGGAIVGYQFSEHFIIEGDYTHYAKSNIGFNSDAIGNFYGIQSLNTDTSTYSLLGKILVPFGFTKVYVYADAGATWTHRKDISTTPLEGYTSNYTMVNAYQLGPSFGFGAAYNITQRLFSQIGFQYSTGLGKADLYPAEDYIPFTYSVLYSLGFRI